MRVRGGCVWLGLLLAACAPRGSRVGALEEARTPATGESEAVTLMPPPPLSEGIFPCSDCHASQETRLTRRVLDTHGEIQLRHGDRERWCFDCHDPEDRDQVRLTSGALVPLAESHRLCGQCHGDKHRDWRTGVHGKRIGSWSGAKRALVCRHCHDAHAPHFKAMAPLPPPPRPEQVGR